MSFNLETAQGYTASLIKNEEASVKKMQPLYSLAEAFEYCHKICRGHYENFPVASLVLPRAVRPYVACVYAFARTADDFADEKEHEGSRRNRLEEWDNQLKMMEVQTPSHPIFIALRDTAQRFRIPRQLFHDLITAFKMDVNINRYETFNDVMRYCRYSANPVGRVILHIMGYPAPRLLSYSDSICTALQLANFWQDVTIDLTKDRVYIPREDLWRFGYSEEDLFKRVYNNNFRRLMTFQIDRTLEIFENGKPLCSKIPGRFGFELKMTWLGGVTILKKIISSGGNVFNRRPKLARTDFIWIFLKALNLGTHDKT